jgi:hypothetical protein
VIKAILLLVAILAPAPAWAGAGGLGNIDVTISSGIPNYQRLKSQDEKYFIAFTTGTIGTSEADAWLFVNRSTNTVSAYLEFMDLSVLTSGAIVTVRAYRNAVVTSSGTPVSLFPGNLGGTSVSKMEVYKAPSISSRGTLVYVRGGASGTNRFDFNQSRIVPPGATFILTGQSSSANTSVMVSMEWVEE